MERVIIPKYVDTIIIDNYTKKNVKLIKKAGLFFDECGECELTMEFYDGVAYEVTGTGLMLRYPKMKDLTTGKENAICDYTGIWDGEINQHDVALKYGVLELSSNDADKIIHTTKDDQAKRDETLAILSADIYQRVYDSSDDCMDYNRAARIMAVLADEFEKLWQEKKLDDPNDELDFIYELEDFEERALKDVERKLNIDSKYD